MKAGEIYQMVEIAAILGLASGILATLILVGYIRKDAKNLEAKAENIVRQKQLIIDEYRAKTFLIISIRMSKRMSEKYELMKGISENMKAFSERLSKLGSTAPIDSYIRTIEEIQLPSELSFMYQIEEEDRTRLMSVLSISIQIKKIPDIFSRIADRTAQALVSGFICALAVYMLALIVSLGLEQYTTAIAVIAFLLGLHYFLNGIYQIWPLNQSEKKLKQLDISTSFEDIKTNTLYMLGELTLV